MYDVRTYTKTIFITITFDTSIVKSITHIENPVFIESLKIIGAQYQFPITFGTALVRNKILKVRNSPLSHTLNSDQK